MAELSGAELLEVWKREHDLMDINPEVIHQVCMKIWASLNGEAPMPGEYPDYLMKHLSVATQIIFADLTAVYNRIQYLANISGFRGYYATLAALKAVPNPVSGDYAWVAEVVDPGIHPDEWVYDGQYSVWVDTGRPIPNGTPIPIGTTDPLMDGAAHPGTTAEYSPIDHVHPSDTSRAAKADFDALNGAFSDLLSAFNTYISVHTVTGETFAAEIERAQEAEGAAMQAAADEETRAKGAEGDILSEFAAVQSAMESKYDLLDDALTAEAERAALAESALDGAKQPKIAGGSDSLLGPPPAAGGAPAVLALSDFARKGIPLGNKTDVSALILEPDNSNSYNQGLRINQKAGWAGIVLGGQAGTKQGVDNSGYDADQGITSSTRRATWFIASNTNGDLVLQQQAVTSPGVAPQGLYLTRDGRVFIGSTESQQVMTAAVIKAAKVILYGTDMGLGATDPGQAAVDPFYVSTNRQISLNIDVHTRVAILMGFLQIGKSFTGGWDIPQLEIPNKYLPTVGESVYLMLTGTIHFTGSAVSDKRQIPRGISAYLQCPPAAQTEGSRPFNWRFSNPGDIAQNQFNECFINCSWRY